MLVKVYARLGLALMAGLLLTSTGCRSSTDRIRVLEAEKAQAERQNQDLQHQQAELRASMIKAEGQAESEKARAEALQAKLELERSRTPATTGPASEQTTVDIDALKRAFAGTSAVVTRSGEGVTISLPSDITFRAGRADLSKDALGTLERVARALKETNGLARLKIEGHTDADPIRKSGWRDNEELSLARAASVQKFLVSQGIEETMLDVDGAGASKPIASNDTAEGKALNRRVEIILYTRK